MSTLKFDANSKFTTLLGRTNDGARYSQNGYRYTANREIIGDPIELAKEAKARQLKEAEEKVAEARKAFETVEAETAAVLEGAEDKKAAVEEVSVEATANKIEAVPPTELETVVDEAESLAG